MGLVEFMTRWRWRGSVAMLAVAVGFVIYPLIESEGDVINSDWPAFATGARIMVSDPGHLYDFDVQRRVELDVTGGRTLVTLGINGIPAWVIDGRLLVPGAQPREIFAQAFAQLAES